MDPVVTELEAAGLTGGRLIRAVAELTGLPLLQARQLIAIERLGDEAEGCCGCVRSDRNLVRALHLKRRQ